MKSQVILSILATALFVAIASGQDCSQGQSSCAQQQTNTNCGSCSNCCNKGCTSQCAQTCQSCKTSNCCSQAPTIIREPVEEPSCIGDCLKRCTGYNCNANCQRICYSSPEITKTSPTITKNESSIIEVQNKNFIPVNVTTYIKLTNQITNVNKIYTPINITNVNHNHMTSKSESVVPVVNTTAPLQKCCFILHPVHCHNIYGPPFIKCTQKREWDCSDMCTSVVVQIIQVPHPVPYPVHKPPQVIQRPPIVIREPPKYVPYPVPQPQYIPIPQPQFIPQPIVQQPIIPQPQFIPQPIVQQPIIPQPQFIQQPIIQQPIVQQPIISQPQYIPQPIIQQQIIPQPQFIPQPIVQQPIVQQPIVQQPIVQQPMVQPPYTRCHYINQHPWIRCHQYQATNCGGCYYCNGQLNPGKCGAQQSTCSNNCQKVPISEDPYISQLMSQYAPMYNNPGIGQVQTGNSDQNIAVQPNPVQTVSG